MDPKDSYLWPYILAKRAKLSKKRRERFSGMNTRIVWKYPYTEEVKFKILIKAVLEARVSDPLLEAAEKQYSQLLRQDSASTVHLDDLNDLKGILTRIALVAFPDSNFLNNIARSISRQSKKQWNKFVKQATGVDLTLFETEAEREAAAEWAQDNMARLQNYARANAKKINEIVSEGAASNKPWSTIKDEIIKANVRATNRQAAYMARDATGNLNSKLQQALSKEAGIEAYKWNTKHDRKVRGTPWGLYPKTKYSHYLMNGVLRRWSDGKISKDDGKTWRRVRGREEPEHAGEAPNCRCTGEPFFLSLINAADKELS